MGKPGKNRVLPGEAGRHRKGRKAVGNIVQVNNRSPFQGLPAPDRQPALGNGFGNTGAHGDEMVNHDFVTLGVVKVKTGQHQLRRGTQGGHQRKGGGGPVGGHAGFHRPVGFAAAHLEIGIVRGTGNAVHAVAPHPVQGEPHIGLFPGLFHPDHRVAGRQGRGKEHRRNDLGIETGKNRGPAPEAPPYHHRRRFRARTGEKTTGPQLIEGPHQFDHRPGADLVIPGDNRAAFAERGHGHGEIRYGSRVAAVQHITGKGQLAAGSPDNPRTGLFGNSGAKGPRRRKGAQTIVAGQGIMHHRAALGHGRQQRRPDGMAF